MLNFFVNRIWATNRNLIEKARWRPSNCTLSIITWQGCNLMLRKNKILLFNFNSEQNFIDSVQNTFRKVKFKMQIIELKLNIKNEQ